MNMRDRHWGIAPEAAEKVEGRTGRVRYSLGDYLEQLGYQAGLTSPAASV